MTSPSPQPDARAVTRSQGVLLGSHAVNLLISVGITVVLGRVLEPGDFGFFALISSLFALASFAMDSGTGSMAVREISRDPSREKELLEGLLGFRRGLGWLIALLIFGWAMLEPSRGRAAVLVGAAFVVPFQAAGGLAPVFQRRQANEGPALITLGGLLLVLLGVMAMAMTQAAGHLFSWLVVTREFLVSRVFRWLAIRRLGYRPRPGLRGRKLGPFFRMAALYGLAILSYQLCFHVDVFMVRALCGEEALGAYAAAFRPMNPMLRVAGLLMLPMLPVIARTALSNRERFVGQVVRSSEVLVGLGGLGAVAAIMLAEDLLQLLYGDKYVSGPLSTVEALRWLAVALAVVFSSTAFTTALLAAGRERWLCILGLCGLAVNVAGNLVFLPTHGFTAAAATTAATEALLASGAIVCLVRTAPVSGIRPIFVLTLAPAAILGFVLYWLPGPSPWRIVAGTLLGLAGLAFLVLGPPGRRLRRTLADLAS